ncbi:hypothetical protein CDCA_CDCA06G1877 [Cyanidium caldarium]|uniref:HEAT repeat domain-containing protein n=1 Tax=Cyanidium caldarium TaxID=2771 RepID=A0AAV9IUC9_CYACA|nr:hypothetical protein CDCA_CDCA06G1877 [Cyanidium caldarium]
MQCRRTTHEQAAPVLIAAATRFEPEVQNRSFTAIALGNMPNARSYELLSTMLRTDDAGEVRASAAAGLGYLGDARALPELRLALLEDHHWSTRISAAVALGMLRDQRAVDVLMDGLRGAFTRSAAEKEALQRACIGSLGELGATAAMPQLLPFAQARDFLTRQVLAEALGALMPSCNTPDTAAYRQAAEKCLQHLAQDAHTNVRDAAQIAWRRLADEAEKEGVE